MKLDVCHDWENPSMLGRNKRTAHTPLRSHLTFNSAVRHFISRELNYKGGIRTLSTELPIVPSAAVVRVKSNTPRSTSSLSVDRSLPSDAVIPSQTWNFQLFQHPGDVPTGFQLSAYNDDHWVQVSMAGSCPGQCNEISATDMSMMIDKDWLTDLLSIQSLSCS